MDEKLDELLDGLECDDDRYRGGREEIIAHVRSLVEAERERCARVCEREAAGTFDVPGRKYVVGGLKRAAAEIRKGE